MHLLPPSTLSSFPLPWSIETVSLANIPNSMLRCHPFAPTCKNWDCPTFGGRDLVPFHTLMVAKQWAQLSPPRCVHSLWPCFHMDPGLGSVLLGNGTVVHVTSRNLEPCHRLTGASQLQTEGTRGGETTHQQVTADARVSPTWDLSAPISRPAQLSPTPGKTGLSHQIPGWFVG